MNTVQISTPSLPTQAHPTPQRQQQPFQSSQGFPGVLNHRIIPFANNKDVSKKQKNDFVFNI